MPREVDHQGISTVHGLPIKIREFGRGRPLLFLGAGMGIDPGMGAVELLARKFRVIVPTHPGFEGSERPRWCTSVDDLSYIYLDLFQEHGLQDAVLVGVSFGGWIAAEIAVKSTAHISQLVLADAVGIKVNDRETRDIADIFAMTQETLSKLLFATPGPRAVDYPSMPDADVLTVTRNREALARFAWSPYMHNPKLRTRLHRITVPTLFLWGAQDGIVSEQYGQAYCAGIPGAKFAVIDDAGHLPQIDQPEAFARHILNFTEQSRGAEPRSAGAQ